ncbi:hypothetical protein [Jannaschia donghaensis]|uniref:Uncharacterized protein n=1 Tax=Jannaschia donghaensis TaxID=420998 RepID=A0A0M6YDP7_9RHOB|nr:hypothetical protein [Jannaschia donghaensis]CTQ48471.1 hypothetical protein JDO7802_00473 [Jannaschia donghaensis]
MTDKAELTTKYDDNPTRHRLMLMGLVWLSVYPVVTIGSYLLGPFELPLFIETFLTTMCSVPLITFLVVPNAKALIAKADPRA